MVINMIADLSQGSGESEDENAVLARAGVTLAHARGLSDDERAWLLRTFTPTWMKEAEAGWNWFAKDATGVPVGFASYEQRRYRWWWLRRWTAQPEVGIFGPMGVDPHMRGKGLGCVLARRALDSIRALGYTRAAIPE